MSAPHPAPDIDVRTRTDLWRLHPQGDYLLSRGGDLVPPPAYINMVLTNKCNLRCEICGSQKTLDATKTTRSHLPLDVFLNIADTVFPVVSEVELNSQGDPLLYPQIETVLAKLQEHRCELRLQTNGTLFSEAVVERLLSMHGTVYLSIDAVGPTFDKVRRNGVWANAEPGILSLLSRRDPARLAVRLYPTVTARTLEAMGDVVRWAAEHDVDGVEFHNYNPVQGSFEREPDPDALNMATDGLRDWLAGYTGPMMVAVNSTPLTPGQWRRQSFACQIKSRFINADPLYPLDASHPWAAKRSLCMAPFRQLDISLTGQISACCRSQDIVLGEATSVETFANLWFGHNYQVLRESLTRGDAGPLPLPNCLSCIRYFAPEAGRSMVALDYAATPDHPRALRAEQDRIPLALVRRAGASGRRFVGQIPPGLDLARYRLFEDDRSMEWLEDAGEATLLAPGQYSVQGSRLYFIPLDPDDPIRNGRDYALRPQ